MQSGIANKSSQFNQTETQRSKRRRLLETLKNASYHLTDNEETEKLSEMLELTKHSNTEVADFQELARTIRETLLEIAVIKERNLERRHRELMQLLDKHLNNENEQVEPIVDKQEEPTVDETTEREAFTGSTLLQKPIEVDDGNIVIETIDDDDPVIIDEELEEIDQEAVEEVPTNPGIETTSSAINYVAARPVHAQNEFQLMREKMLEMQRQKMEDRERKKRESMKLL